MSVSLVEAVKVPIAFDPGGNDALRGLVRDCMAADVSRRVLMVRVDLLPPRLSRPHHLRLAVAALDPLLTAERARAHDLPGGRLAVSWRGDASALLQRSLAALERLFEDEVRIGPTALPSLFRLFDLPADGAALLAAAGLDEAEHPALRGSGGAADVPPALLPLDAAALSAMEGQLVAADMSRFARRKPICQLDDGHPCTWAKRAGRRLAVPPADPCARPPDAGVAFRPSGAARRRAV